MLHQVRWLLFRFAGVAHFLGFAGCSEDSNLHNCIVKKQIIITQILYSHKTFHLKVTPKLLWAFLLSFVAFTLSAQDNRTQYPKLLSNAYFSVNIGHINYPFSNEHIEPGYSAESVKIPHLAVRLLLFGYKINDRLSAQMSYMRPVNWVEYQNINGDKSSRSVYMNIAGLTLKSQLPVTKKLSVSGEAGLGIITRNGFNIDEKPVIKDANFATILSGVGLEYHLNNKWNLLAGATYAPSKASARQPHILFLSGGFRYNMNRLSDEKVASNARSGFFFPHHLVQLGYTTNSFGYNVNTFFGRTAHIFWEGDSEVETGLSLRYQRNVFHTRKVFSFDVGTSFSYWKSRKNKEAFYTLSLYPLLRFTVLRTRPADFYLFYSVAGPTYISRVVIDGEDTGRHFTFQDFMGLGSFFGKKRNLNAEININHYSNGNIFPKNGGVKVPLTFMVGYTFN